MNSGQWKKFGVVYRPNSSEAWMRTHAMIPTPLHLSGNRYRIYFGGRNELNQSSIGFFEVDLSMPDKILEESHAPVLTPGRLGCFDDNGVLPSCVVRTENELILYYIGFKPGGTTRMDLYGGVSISNDGGLTFERWSEAPIIERCRVNPFINTAPWVVRHGCNEWVMYYVAGVEWIHKDLPRYNIQVAQSRDGFRWERDGTVAIDFAERENAIARPYVWKPQGCDDWKMLFSAKGESYRIFSADSCDGRSWIREPNHQWFDVTPGGPDEEMVAYPVLLEADGRQIVYYNGNG